MDNQTNYTEPEGEAPWPSSRTGFLQKLSSVAVGVALLAMMVVAGCDSGNGGNGNGNGGDEVTASVDTFYISDATPSLDAGGEVEFTYTISVESGELESSTLEFGDGESVDVSEGENLSTNLHPYETGSYTAEILLNGESQSTVEFEVVGTNTMLIEAFDDTSLAVEPGSCCAGDGEIVATGVNDNGEFEFDINEVNGNWNNFGFTDPEGEDGDGFPVFERPTLQLDMAVDGDRDFPVRAGYAQGGGGLVQASVTDTVRYDVPAVDAMQTYYFDYSEETGIGLQNFGDPVDPDSVDGSVWELRFNFYDNGQEGIEEGKDPESWVLRVDNLALHSSRNPLAEPLGEEEE